MIMIILSKCRSPTPSIPQNTFLRIRDSLWLFTSLNSRHHCPNLTDGNKEAQ